MKITALETVQVPDRRNLLWVRLHTDEGIVGIGEAPGPTLPTIRTVIEAEMAQFLVGPISEVVGDRATTITHRPLPTGAASHYGRGRPEDPKGEVENEDFASMLCRFANGATGTFEVSRTMVGPESQNAFEVYGTEGALAWNLERINELQYYRKDAGVNAGYTTIFGGDRFPFHGAFVPGQANAIGFEDLVAIEDH